MSHLTTDKTYQLGIFITLISAIAYSLKAIFVKLAFHHHVDPLTLLNLRMLFSAPFFVAILIITRQSAHKLTWHDLVGITITGILGFYLSSLLDFIGLQYISAALERMILFTYPIFVLFISSFINKRSITKKQLQAVFITYLGLLFVFWSELHIDQKDVIRGSLFIFACAITFALYYVGSEKLIPRLGSLRYTSYTLLLTTIFVAIHAQIAAPVLTITTPIVHLSLLLAIISTVIPTLLLSLGIKMIGAPTAATVSTIGPIATILLAHIFLGEALHPLQLIGGAIVIAGVVLLGKRKFTSAEVD